MKKVKILKRKRLLGCEVSHTTSLPIKGDEIRPCGGPVVNPGHVGVRVVILSYVGMGVRVVIPGHVGVHTVILGFPFFIIQSSSCSPLWSVGGLIAPAW